MEWVGVSSQSEMDAAVEAGKDVVVTKGLYRAYGSSQVRAYGNSQVQAYDNSQVQAYDNSQVQAYDSSQVDAAKSVAVTFQPTVTVTGGVQIPVPTITTVEEWCDFHGVRIVDEQVTIFKAVSAEWESSRGFHWIPGTVPEAPDWDGGEAECGNGFHFSPRPWMGREFHRDAQRFVAVPVAVGDIRPPAVTDSYPQKVKARRACGPVYEVDEDGNPVTESP